MLRHTISWPPRCMSWHQFGILSHIRIARHTMPDKPRCLSWPKFPDQMADSLRVQVDAQDGLCPKTRHHGCARRLVHFSAPFVRAQGHRWHWVRGGCDREAVVHVWNVRLQRLQLPPAHLAGADLPGIHRTSVRPERRGSFQSWHYRLRLRRRWRGVAQKYALQCILFSRNIG